MAWLPGAIVKEVTRHRTVMTARRFVFHTAVSGGSSLFDYFNQSGNPTSHFYVRADGTIEQYVDTQYRAPAQLEGNHDCISVESQDMGAGFPAWGGSDVPAWTPQQMTALTALAAWVHVTHGIPLSMLPDSVTGRTGYGYHRQGVNPWRVPNGELWSNSTGKVCPGDRRIAQIPTILTNASQGDDCVTPEDKAWIEQKFNGTIDRVVAIHQATVDQAAPGDAVLKQWIHANYLGTVNRIVEIHGATVTNPPTVDVAALAAALAPLLPPGVALTPDDVAAIAAAAAVTVNDELAARTSPPPVA